MAFITEIETPVLDDKNSILNKKVEQFKHYITNKQKTININVIIEHYQPIVNTFNSYLNTIQLNEIFKSKLVKFINKLIEVYEIPTQPVLIVPHFYDDVDNWGRLVWTFLHYSSILFQYAKNKNLIKNEVSLSYIIYNLNFLIQCSICKAHYLQLKDDKNNKLKPITISLSYGFIIYEIFHLHTIISLNKAQYRKIPYVHFSIFDFLLKYKCLPNLPDYLYDSNDEIAKIHDKYINLPINFYDESTSHLIIILYLYLSSTHSKITLNNLLSSIENWYNNKNITNDDMDVDELEKLIIDLVFESTKKPSFSDDKITQLYNDSMETLKKTIAQTQK